MAWRRRHSSVHFSVIMATHRLLKTSSTNPVSRAMAVLLSNRTFLPDLSKEMSIDSFLEISRPR